VGLADPVAPTVASRALDAGLIINAANEHRIRLAPPLIIGEQELAEFTRKFAHALDIPHPTDPGARA